MNVGVVVTAQKTTQGDQYQEFTLRAMIEKKPEPVPAAAAPEPAAKPGAKKKGVQP
jgi:hypothetical protein